MASFSHQAFPLGKAAWWDAAEIFSRAAIELSDRIGRVSKPEYQRLKTVTENARARSVQAQANLNAHIAGHGCNGELVALSHR